MRSHLAAAHGPGHRLTGTRDGQQLLGRRLSLSQRLKKSVGHCRDVVYRAVECCFVGPRRHPVAADLADELQGRGANLFIGGPLIASTQGLYASAHLPGHSSVFGPAYRSPTLDTREGGGRQSLRYGREPPANPRRLSATLSITSAESHLRPQEGVQPGR